MSRRGPIYETTFFVNGDCATEFDEWLLSHARDARLEEDVSECRVFILADDANGRHGRICQYVLTDDDVASEFVDGFGTDVEAEAEARFDVLFSSRLLREDTAADVASDENPDCLNCGTRLRGQYCGSCGQRARSKLISLWELIADAFGDLFELDSRLWKTLLPLLLKPGHLTRDYLSGKRARFMPPFRTYLVLSLLFFLVAFFDPIADLDLDVPDESPATGQGSDAEAARQQLLDELAAAGIEIGGENVPPEVAAQLAEAGNKTVDIGLTVNGTTIDSDCVVTADDLEDVPAVLRAVITPQRVSHICRRLNEEPSQLIDNLLDNVPAALIVLLPLMALVLRMLYPLSRHYYVEHLLFFIHFHAFLFLLLTLQVLLSRLGGLPFVPDVAVVLVIIAASLYQPVYLFIAMRRVYLQGFFLTLLKFLVLIAAYFAGFTLTMLGAFTVAALSI